MEWADRGGSAQRPCPWKASGYSWIKSAKDAEEVFPEVPSRPEALSVTHRALDYAAFYCFPPASASCAKCCADHFPGIISSNLHS